MNSIPEEHNSQRQLDRLAAQRQLYTEAKRLEALRTIIAVPLVFAWSVAAAAYTPLKVYAAAWGILVTLLDLALLNPWQRSLQRQAAKIQELVDCDLLQIEWLTLKVGRRPNPESILEAASRFKRSDPECASVRDWYPKEIDSVPLHLARIICQRSNCWWDAKLRRRYAVNALGVVAILSVVVLVIGLIGGLTVQNLVLSVLAPLMPAFVWAIRQYNEQKEYAIAADRLKDYTEDLWQRAISGSASPAELAKESRLLQDEIYDRRQRGPLIFDWVYRRLRNEYEEQMNVGAKEMIAEALE